MNDITAWAKKVYKQTQEWVPAVAKVQPAVAKVQGKRKPGRPKGSKNKK